MLYNKEIDQSAAGIRMELMIIVIATNLNVLFRNIA